MRSMALPAGTGAAQAARDFAKQLHAKWGVGDAACNNGVLLLLSVGDRQVYISTGAGEWLLHRLLFRCWKAWLAGCLRVHHWLPTSRCLLLCHSRSRRRPGRAERRAHQGRYCRHAALAAQGRL